MTNTRTPTAGLKTAMIIVCGPAAVFFLLAAAWGIYRFSIDGNPLWFMTILFSPCFAALMVFLIRMF